MPDRDPLEGLRRAWRGIEPPEPDRSLESPDAPTRAALEWMREAWRALEPPAARLPWRLRRRVAARLVRPLAAAAALLVAVLLATRVPRVEPPRSTPGNVAEPAAPAPEIRLAALEAGRMEMRSGPVRLILVSGGLPPAENRR